MAQWNVSIVAHTWHRSPSFCLRWSIFFDEIAMSLDSCMIGLGHLINKNLSPQRKEFAPGRVNSLLEELTLHFEAKHNENGSLLKGYLLPLNWEGSLG